MSDKQSVSGVGGWLAFLVAAMVVLLPIVGTVELSRGFEDIETKAPQILFNMQYIQFKDVVWAIFVISAIASIAGGLSLAKHFYRSSVRFAIWMLWLRGPVCAFAYLVAAIIVIKLDVRTNASAPFVSAIIIDTLVAVIWTAYLLRSKRVKNTYVDPWQDSSHTADGDFDLRHPDRNRNGDPFEAYVKQRCRDYPIVRAQMEGPAGKELLATLGLPESARFPSAAEFEASIRQGIADMTPEQRADAARAMKMFGIK